MMPILGDEMPPVNIIWNWVPTICAMIAALATLGLWLNSRKTSRMEVVPSPLVIKAEDDFVHKDEFEKYVSEYRRSLNEIEKDRLDASGRLHEKINGVDRKVSALEQKTELQNQQLARMDAKLDRLVERKQS